MRKLLSVGSILLLGLTPSFLFAGAEEDIRATVLSFQRCLSQGEYAGSMKYLSRDFLAMLQTTPDGPAWIKKEMSGPFQEEAEIVSVKAETEHATVLMKLPGESAGGPRYLVKESGSWKISPAPSEKLAAFREMVKKVVRERKR